MTDKTDRKKAQEKRYRQRKDVKSKYAKYQKENFKNISASIPRAEAEYIAALFRLHDLKPSEVIRGAAAALADGQPIRTEREPLIIPPEYQTPTDTQSDSGSTNEPPTT